MTERTGRSPLPRGWGRGTGRAGLKAGLPVTPRSPAASWVPPDHPRPHREGQRGPSSNPTELNKEITYIYV